MNGIISPIDGVLITEHVLIFHETRDLNITEQSDSNETRNIPNSSPLGIIIAIVMGCRKGVVPCGKNI
jgi:hypothetical protein